MPALMVTAGKDQVLLPAFTKGMEDLVRKTNSETLLNNHRDTTEQRDIRLKWPIKRHTKDPQNED